MGASPWSDDAQYVIVADPVEDVLEGISVNSPVGELDAITPSEVCAE